MRSAGKERKEERKGVEVEERERGGKGGVEGIMEGRGRGT